MRGNEENWESEGKRFPLINQDKNLLRDNYDESDDGFDLPVYLDLPTSDMAGKIFRRRRS